MIDRCADRPRRPCGLGKTGLLCAELLAGILAVSVSAKAVLAEDSWGLYKPDDATATRPIPESKCISEAKIAEMERAFLKFGDVLLSMIDEHVTDPEMRENIRSAIATMRANKKTPRCAEVETAVPFGKEDGFGYQFVKGARRAAAFKGMHRVMQLSPGVDYTDPVKTLDLLHELAHVWQDDQLRQSGRVTERRYVEVYSSFGVVIAIPKNEAKAIAIEVEAMNAMTQGALKTAVLSGNTERFVMANEAAREYLLNAASEYYGHTPAHFLKFVTDEYRNRPGTLFYDENLIRTK